MGLMIIFSVLQAIFGIIILIIIESRIFSKLIAKCSCRKSKISDSSEQNYLNEVIPIFNKKNVELLKR